MGSCLPHTEDFIALLLVAPHHVVAQFISCLKAHFVLLAESLNVIFIHDEEILGEVFLNISIKLISGSFARFNLPIGVMIIFLSSFCFFLIKIFLLLLHLILILATFYVQCCVKRVEVLKFQRSRSYFFRADDDLLIFLNFKFPFFKDLAVLTLP